MLLSYDQVLLISYFCLLVALVLPAGIWIDHNLQRNICQFLLWNRILALSAQHLQAVAHLTKSSS